MNATTALTSMNKADCLANDVLTVTLSNIVLAGGYFQLWATTEGKDCQADTIARTQKFCWQVSGDIIQSPIDVSVRKLVPLDDDGHAGQEPDVVTPDISICDAPLQAPNQVTLQLYAFDSNNAMKPAVAKVGLTVDLVGPNPPAVKAANAGDGNLILDWSGSNPTSIGGYEMYCAEAEASADGTDCQSEFIKEGGEPPAEYKRGNITSGTATSGTAGGLTNNVVFACAVSASDLVFNRGKLSNVVCGMPLETTSYLEAYRAAGGDAGGGYCAFGRASSKGGATAGVILVALGLLLRRSRRGVA